MRLLLPEVVRGGRTRQTCGLAASVSLHVVTFVILTSIPLDRVTPSAEPAASRDVVTFVAPSASIAVRDPALQEHGDRLEPSAAPLAIAGTTFDVAHIRSRRDWLFPFLTRDLLFLEGLDDQVRVTRGRLPNPFPPREPRN